MPHSQSWPITKIIVISEDIFSSMLDYLWQMITFGFINNLYGWEAKIGVGDSEFQMLKCWLIFIPPILTLYNIIYYYSSPALRSETKGSGPCQPDWRGNLPKVRTLELNCNFEYISKSAHLHKSCAKGSLNPLSEWTLSTGQGPFLGMWTSC